MPSIFSRRIRRGGLAALFVLAAFAAVPALAGAATVTVNTTADNPPGPGQCEGVAGDCSLRQAIDVANGEPGSNRVIVPAGHYTLTIEPTVGDDNDSGDLNVKGEVTIEGAGARKSIIDAGSIEDRALELIEGNLRMVGLGVTGGSTEENGGGIFVEEGDLRLDGVAITDNESFESGGGGGIEQEEGNLEIVDSVISGNRNSGDGGGLGFYGQVLTIEDSTIADNEVNTALYPSNPGWGAFGGAIETDNTELLVMKNTTIAGNHIVDGNGGEEGSGAALDIEFEHYEIANTIVANNTAVEVGEPGQCTNEAPYGSLGHNLETPEPAGEPRCFEASTDKIGNPLLAALANNGGETDTMALQAGSPAIDAGDPALCLPTDQRGQARVGSSCDIGAFEYVPPATPPLAPSPGSFSFKQVKRNLKKGTAQIKVSFTGSGTATLSGKGIKKVTKKVSTGISKFAVVPTGKVKKKLAQVGKAKVKVTLTFKTAANTVKENKSFVLKLKQ
jgi:CSLREA domain-containing protein